MGNFLSSWIGWDMDFIIQDDLSMTFSSTDCMETISKDCHCPVTDKYDDLINGKGFLIIGKHENQISLGGEVALHTHLVQCEKNPGHKTFIPIENFSLKHLPKGHRDKDLYELVKATADLTVRISVKMTSPERPDFWPNTEIPYHLSELRGQETLRTGTGRVSGVWTYTDEDNRWDYETCPCDKCKASDKPSKVWWLIYVYTASHVVFDDIEASQTTLRLFFDREDSPKIILKDRVRVHSKNVERDKCRFTCVTCDESLGNKLQNMRKLYFNVWEKVRNKYFESRDIHKLNFIVSHPHGCSKQVSIGYWKDKVDIGDDYHKFTYTTSTCPGSSGAFVFCVGYNTWLNDPVHSGFYKPGLNYSGAGGVWR